MNTVSAHTPPGQCSIAPLGARVAALVAADGELHPPFYPLGQGLGAGQRGGVAATGEHGGGARGDIVDVIDRDAGGHVPVEPCGHIARIGLAGGVREADHPDQCDGLAPRPGRQPVLPRAGDDPLPELGEALRASIVGSSGASAGSARLAGVRSRPSRRSPATQAAVGQSLAGARSLARRDGFGTGRDASGRGGSTRRPEARSSSRRSPHHSATSRESPNADVTAGFARWSGAPGRPSPSRSAGRPSTRNALVHDRSHVRPSRSVHSTLGLPSGRPRTPARGARRRTRRTSRGPQPARPS